MAPFAISVATGVYKGATLFKNMIEGSHTFDDSEGRGDKEKIDLFTGLIIFLTGSVTAVPIVTVTIFFYQAYADQYFVMFVIGIEIFVVLKMMKGLMQERLFKMLNYFSLALMLAGLSVWAIMDSQQMIMLALFAARKIGQTPVTVENIAIILKTIINTIFNFYFSQLVSCTAIASLAGHMFSKYDKIYYKSKDGKFVRSKLYHLDVWGKQALKRSRALEMTEVVSEPNEKPTSSTIEHEVTEEVSI